MYDSVRPKDTFINAGVGPVKGTMSYFMLKESSMNTFSSDFIEKNNLKSQIIKTIQVPVYPLKDILKNHINSNDRLDFFDVDAEGYDLEVLKTNDWVLYRPKIVVVETNMSIKEDVNSETVKYLESKNYRLLGKTIINQDLGNLFLISN